MRLNRQPHRRGLTILEVVASLALLGGIASGVMGAISFMQRAQERDRVRLAAHEAAHRLILQYLDDQESVFGRDDPVEVQGLRFAFDFHVTSLSSNDEGAAVDVRSGAVRTGMPGSPEEVQAMLESQLEQVTVQVWLIEPRAGYDAGQPIAQLVRVYDITRDMESLMKTLIEFIKPYQDNQ